MAEFDGFWTNEKHVSFLNWIEASFVRELHKNEDRCLLKYAGRANPSHGHDHHPRLDRYLPDSADSTHDSKRRTNRRKSRVNNEIVGGSGTCEGSSRSDNASQDQVGKAHTQYTQTRSMLTYTDMRMYAAANGRFSSPHSIWSVGNWFWCSAVAPRCCDPGPCSDQTLGG